MMDDVPDRFIFFSMSWMIKKVHSVCGSQKYIVHVVKGIHSSCFFKKYSLYKITWAAVCQYMGCC
jgi:hypothetical protein